jgi:hypothetical protein
MPEAPPPRPTPFPALVGGLLARPDATLAEIDRQGGGVRSATWLVLIGTVCLRLDDLARVFIGWRDTTLLGALRQCLSVLGEELRGTGWLGPVILTIAAGLLITLLAGRGRREPGMDIELGAGWGRRPSCRCSR